MIHIRTFALKRQAKKVEYESDGTESLYEKLKISIFSLLFFSIFESYFFLDLRLLTISADEIVRSLIIIYLNETSILKRFRAFSLKSDINAKAYHLELIDNRISSVVKCDGPFQ